MTIAIVVAVHLRADNGADGKAADDTGGDAAAVTGVRRLRRDGAVTVRAAMAEG